MEDNNDNQLEDNKNVIKDLSKKKWLWLFVSISRISLDNIL
jgi:hypothetical protein